MCRCGNCRKRNVMIEKIKKNWPILFLLLLWFSFSSPYFLKNRVPFSSTYQVNFFPPWSSYPHIGIPVKNNAMPDVITQIYPWRHLGIEEWKSGQIPLWNPYSFGGTPLLANYQSAALNPFNLLLLILPFIDGWSLLVLLQPLLAGIFTYLFARKISLSKPGALLSSIAFMFCGFITVWMGYATLGYAILFLPLALFSLEGYFQTNHKKYLLLFAATFPLSFFSGHFQMSLYFLITVFFYWTYLSFTYRFGKKSILSGLIFLFGFLLTMPQLLPSMEFYSQSLRSNLYQRIEVIPWGYLPTFLAPDFYGNPVTRNDWFGHYAEWNAYIGVLPLLLSWYAVTQWKKKSVRFFLALEIVAFLLAFPTPLGDLLVFSKLPVLSTSAASRIIVLFSFACAVLAGVGLDSLQIDLQKRKWKQIGVWIALSSVLFLSLWVIVLGKLLLPLGKISIARQNLILPTAFFLGGVVAVGVGLLKKKGVVIFLTVILLTSALDIFRFANKWQSFDQKSLVFEPVSATKLFAEIAGYERVLGNYDEHVPVYYHLPSLEGYDPLYPKRTGEFVASLLTGKLAEGERSVVTFPRYGVYTRIAMDLLGFKYVAHKKSDDNMGWTFQYWKYPVNDFPLKTEDSGYRILENKHAYPRAFLVTDYTVLQDSQKILDMLFASSTNLSQTIVIEKQLKMPKLTATEKSLQIASYTSNKITLKSKTNGSSLLFLSDTFYPGWHAYVDGKETEILRADFAFRAIALPEGKHTITFTYWPLSFIAGLVLAAIGLIGVGSFVYLKKE